jgi:uncharacterized caspase-like protein
MRLGTKAACVAASATFLALTGAVAMQPAKGPPQQQMALPQQAIAAPQGKRVAFVVGNSAYQNTAALANPTNDARDMAAALKGLGFDVIEGVDLDKRSLDLKTRDFARALGGADVALFFYAGHGLQVGGQNYLIPVDARLETERDLEFEATKVDFVLRQMELDRDNKTNIVFLDACRDNPLSRNLARSMGTRSASLGQGLAQVQTGVGTFISYSTQPGNVALDGQGRNSPFTTALVKHIASDGMSLNGVMNAVRKEVLSATQGKQVPWDHSSLTGDFFFKTAAAGGGIATSPPGVPSGDMTSLQERMRQLESELKSRPSAVDQAEAIRIADLRNQVRSLDELNKNLQRRLFDTQTNQSRATTPEDRERYRRDMTNIQMEWSRTGQRLKAAREELAKAEAGNVTTGAIPAPPPNAPKN